jgi:hypothetical protein
MRAMQGLFVGVGLEVSEGRARQGSRQPGYGDRAKMRGNPKGEERSGELDRARAVPRVVRDGVRRPGRRRNRGRATTAVIGVMMLAAPPTVRIGGKGGGYAVSAGLTRKPRGVSRISLGGGVMGGIATPVVEAGMRLGGSRVGASALSGGVHGKTGGKQAGQDVALTRLGSRTGVAVGVEGWAGAASGGSVTRR